MAAERRSDSTRLGDGSASVVRVCQHHGRSDVGGQCMPAIREERVQMVTIHVAP